MLSTTEESYHPRRTLESTASLCPPIRRNLSVSSAPQGASRDGGTRDFEAAPSWFLRDPPEGTVDHLRERGGWGWVWVSIDFHLRVKCDACGCLLEASSVPTDRLTAYGVHPLSYRHFI